MSSFAFLILCIQVCLIQNVYSNCIGAGLGPGLANPAMGLANPAMGLGNPAMGLANPAMGLAASGIAPVFDREIAGEYGGSGIGDVAVAGEMPVAGTTLVIGQVPILGAVRFAGDLPAGGIISISGSCGCGGGSIV